MLREYDRQMKSGVRVAIGLAVVGVVVVAVLAATQPGSPVASLLRKECGVGLAGTALTVTVEGPDANAECDSLLGTAGPDGASWYRLDGEEPTGYLVCRQPSGSSMVTVRDQGALMLYGHSVCESLEAQAAPVADPGANEVSVPFPDAPDREWCLRWTDSTPWHYGEAFFALSEGEQEAVRTYCSGEGMPVHLPNAP